MDNKLSKDSFLYILERIYVYAKEASTEARNNGPDPFLDGQCLAFDSVMQVIENELNALGIKLEE